MPSRRAARRWPRLNGQQAGRRARQADGVRAAWLAGDAHPADEPEVIR
jgi:hypothetical protein